MTTPDINSLRRKVSEIQRATESETYNDINTTQSFERLVQGLYFTIQIVVFLIEITFIKNKHFEKTIFLKIALSFFLIVVYWYFFIPFLFDLFISTISYIKSDKKISKFIVIFLFRKLYFWIKE